MSLELHVPVTDTARAIDLLQQAAQAKDFQISKQQLKQAMQKGAVWLTRKGGTQRLRRVTRDLQPGDELHLYYEPKILEQEPLEPTLVADNQEYSVWDKPAMMLPQGSKYGDHCSIARWVEVKRQHPCFIVHRLDRAASGLILLAHSKTAAEKLSELFQQRAIEKHYHVVVEGQFPQQQLTIEEALDGKDAISVVNVIDYDEEKQRSTLDVEILTGRKHQIRRHLAGMDHPVVGDKLYGAEAVDEDLQLRAVSLVFTCPLTGKDQRFQISDCS